MIKEKPKAISWLLIAKSQQSTLNMKKSLKLFPLFSLFLFTLLSCKGQNKDKQQSDMEVPKTNAPEINTEYGWVNTDKSYSLKDFRGKFVLLDFWTFGCINCQHIVPDLEKLEEEYKNELVVVGIHSAKFTREKATKTIKKAIAKFGIEHPVVNDADFKVWDSYGIKAWPTVVLIDPLGKVVGQKSGEGVYAALKPYLEKLLPEYEISEEKITFNLDTEEKTSLRFPSKIIAGQEGNLWISDSGHNRILKISPAGKVLDSIGNGKQGDSEGSFSEASFYEPHGLALKGNLLYIADTKNNKIKLADLEKRSVKTIAGNGEMGYYYFDDKQGVPVNPNSPWDLLIDGENMFIASAGNHQILRMDLKTNKVFRFAGTGREALANGSLKEAAFNQPSGLTKIGGNLYVADAEASAIREIDLKEKEVTTPLGKGLFDFGDVDGNVEKALLQHAVGIEAKDGLIYIADTYNGKIKVLDLQKEQVQTLLSGLNEPNDILFLNRLMFVTNTNDHQLVKIDLEKKAKEVVDIKF